MGLLDPATSDGRVIFFLPWEGNTIAGTMDSPAPVENEPHAAEDEIRWVSKKCDVICPPTSRFAAGMFSVHGAVCVPWSETLLPAKPRVLCPTT